MIKMHARETQDQNMETLHMISNGEPSWLLEKRKEAFDTFVSVQSPLKLHDISMEQEIKASGFADAGSGDFIGEESGAVFINESEMGEYKKQGLVAVSLRDALNDASLSKMLSQHLFANSFTGNKFVSLNSAMWNRGIFVYVPKGLEVKRPLKFGFRQTGPGTGQPGHGRRFQLDRVVVIADENSSITLLQSNLRDSGPVSSQNHAGHATSTSMRIEAVEPFLKEGSRVFYGNVQDFPESHVNLSFKRASVGANAEMTWMDCCFGGRLSIAEVFTDLVAPGASAYNWGLFFGDGKQRFGTFLRNSHLSPNTTSDMLTKGVLDGESNSVYNGTVKIAEKSRNSNGYQRQDILLLSGKANADAKPNLEIDNDEVRCTHGVTIGQVDNEKLFYLMSRGMARREAVKAMAAGFYETILRKIRIKGLREEIGALIGGKLAVTYS